MDVEKDNIGVPKTVHVNAQNQCQQMVVQLVKFGVQIDVLVFVQILTKLVNVIVLKYGIQILVVVIVLLINKNLLKNVKSLTCEYQSGFISLNSILNHNTKFLKLE
jgi:hypothetical protein